MTPREFAVLRALADIARPVRLPILCSRILQGQWNLEKAETYPWPKWDIGHYGSTARHILTLFASKGYVRRIDNPLAGRDHKVQWEITPKGVEELNAFCEQAWGKPYDREVSCPPAMIKLIDEEGKINQIEYL